MKRIQALVALFLLAVVGLGFQHVSGKALPGFGSLVKKCSFAAAALSASAAAASPQFGNVLWSADMENSLNPGSSLSQWYSPAFCEGGCATNNGGGVFNSGTASAGPSFDVAHGGTHSAMLKINTTVESGARLFRWQEPRTGGSNNDLYYRAWYYFPQKYTPTAWWNIMQWKSDSPTQGNNPFFQVNVWNRGDGTMYLFLQQKIPMLQNYQQPQPIGDITVGQWTRIEARYVCSPTATGRVTLWKDGLLIADVTGWPTRYADGDCKWSVNNYSNGLSPNPATVHIDDAAICSGGRCP